MKYTIKEIITYISSQLNFTSIDVFKYLKKAPLPEVVKIFVEKIEKKRLLKAAWEKLSTQIVRLYPEIIASYTVSVFFVLLFKLYLLYHLNVITDLKVNLFLLIFFFIISYYFSWANLLKEFIIIILVHTLPYKMLFSPPYSRKEFIESKFWDEEEPNLQVIKQESFFKEFVKYFCIFLCYLRLIIMMEPLLFTLINLFIIQSLLFENVEIRLLVSLFLIISRLLFMLTEPKLKLLRESFYYNEKLELPYTQLYPCYRNSYIVLLWIIKEFLMRYQLAKQYQEVRWLRPEERYGYISLVGHYPPPKSKRFRESILPSHSSNFINSDLSIKLEEEFLLDTMLNMKEPQLLNPMNNKTELYPQILTYESRMLKVFYLYILPALQERGFLKKENVK